MSEDVSIVGGGVLGLSAGVWLELGGYDTHIVTEQRTAGVGPEDAPPSVASPYAAASIIPHQDPIRAADRVMAVSNAAFEHLAQPGLPVCQRRHVVLHEGDAGDAPSYAQFMPAFRSLDRGRDPVPVRDGVETDAIEGWAMEPYFVSTPQYLHVLEEMYRAVGGGIDHRHVSSDTIDSLPGDAVVNATGLGAREIVDDPALHPAKGYLVLARDVNDPTHEGNTYSYNYYPSTGEGVELYCYPREGELVLGGTYLEGEVGPDGEWRGAEPPGEMATVGDLAVPRWLVDLNQQLLESNFATGTMQGVVGHRPVRDGGARVERDRIDGVPVVHNYGHGGAGVTYSWGSAALVEELLEDVVATSASGPVLEELGRVAATVV